MFSNCTSLVGAASYNSTKVDISMANYTTGYLTYKSNNQERHSITNILSLVYNYSLYIHM